MAEQYSMEKYAEVLCEAVEEYDYPAIIYDFDSRKEINYCESDPEHESETHREHMFEMEEKIRSQLLCKDIEVVKDGLSSVLYWGNAKDSRQGYRVSEFCKGVTTYQLNRFKCVADSLTGTGLARIRGRVNNKKDNMPQFTQTSLVSKVRMFLDPNKYPVLDMNLAEEFSQLDCFPPLEGLTFRKKKDFPKKNKHETQIRITKHNEEVYAKWALWCGGIARLVNCELSSVLRAVDVERAIYQLECDGETSEAWRLLACPEGQTHQSVIDLARRTYN